jgi:outer membrane lipoprotein SlyB
MNNPKIKVEADLSSFDAELNKLKTQIAQLGDALKTETGKAHFNFDGSQKELNALLKQTDKLTAALEKGDKVSKQYARNLKAAQEAMAGAAKVAAKLENLGDTKTNQASNYFRNYSGELTEDYHTSSAQQARERFREQQAQERHAQQTRWAQRATRFAGFVGGAAMGGGGGYSALGSGIGSMLPGPLGLVGGFVGGAADRAMGPARSEAVQYSELRRQIGSTSNDFAALRDSVRSVIDGLGVTDNEAANLAKQFAKTASLSGDSVKDIARGVGTSAGFAQGYGISPEQATSFFASMRLTGNSNNDKDSRRLALMIGESVQKGGTTARMDEVLGAISSFAAKSAQQTLTAPNVGEFSSYMASLTGSQYAGLKGDPNSAANLLNRADDAVRNGGTMGEASQYHWLQARQSAFKGMSALDNSTMQGAGLTGDLAAQFAPGSAVYEAASPADRAKMDRTRASIQSSGMGTNFKVGMAHIKAISHGDSYLENANFRGMFGGNTQQAAALMMQLQKDGGVGGFEKQLSQYGVNLDNVNVSQIAAYSSLIGGGDQAQAKQYEKLLGSGKMSASELDAADKVMATEGYGENFKKMLFKLTEKYDTDDGQKSLTTQIDIANKIQGGVTSLVGIETDVREYLLRLLNHFGAASSVDRAVSGYKDGAPMSGVNGAGGKFGGYFGDKHYLEKVNEVDSALKDMAMTSSVDEKKRIHARMKGLIEKNPERYPLESMQWLNKALGDSSGAVKKGSMLPADTSAPTINADGSRADRNVVGLVKSQSPYDDLISKVAGEVGVDPAVLKQIAAQESSLNPNAVNDNGSSKDYGLMQHNSRYMGERGLDSSNVLDSESNLRAGAKFFKGLLDRSGGNYREAFRRYNGSGAKAERYADNSMATYNAIHASDQMPESSRPSAGPRSDNKSLMEFTHNIHLRDSSGNLVSDPLIFTHFGAPMAAGT